MHSEQYHRRKNLAIYWHNKASDLRGSAGALWASMSAGDSAETAERLGLGRGFAFSVACWPVYLMLCGMSLELLFKAVLVAQGKTPTATHDLVKLSEQAELSFSTVEGDVLRVLTGSIVWEGRYPVPKNEGRFADDAELRYRVLFDEFPLGKLKARRGNDSLAWDNFQMIWASVYAAYSRATSAKETHSQGGFAGEDAA